MVQGLFCCHSFEGVVDQHSFQQVNPFSRNLSAQGFQDIVAPFGESRFEIFQACYLWPDIQIRGSQDSKDTEQLIDFRISTEKALFMGQLKEDASYRPYIYSWVIFLCPQKNLRSSIPQGNDLMGIFLHRILKSPGKTKVGKLNMQIISLDEYVLRLEVPVNDSISMTVFQREQKLIDDIFNILFTENNSLHISLQIAVDKIKDQMQQVFSRDDFTKGNYVGVAECFQDGYFSDGSGWDSFIFVVQPDLFDSDYVVSMFIPGLVDNSIGSFSYFVDPLISLDLVLR